MRSCCGENRVLRQSFELASWLQEGFIASLAGVVADTDRLSLADLRIIVASLVQHENTWLILLVGDRGVAGFEELLDYPNTVLLPKPWTPQGIHQAFRRMNSSGIPKGAFPQEFLDGMVEGLRDPLTSISGYLQLLGNQANESTHALITPALDAATQLASQLEFLHLAAAELHPHPASHDLSHLAEELVEYAEKSGVDIDIDLVADLHVEADVRYVRAAMQSALLLLQRFGSGGQITLRTYQEGRRSVLLWQQGPPPTPPQHPIPPPAYLENLFERLCRRIPAQATIEHVHGDIPQVIGIRW
jgi:signal transduction histidine kinase